MPEAPVISAPAPAAPSAPAAPAPVSSTPAAPAPVTPSAPAVTPSAPAAPSTPAAFDPQTSATPPNSADYPSDAEGQVRFMSDNSKWSLSHEEEAGKIREAKLAAENGEEVTQPTAELTQKVEEAEQPQPDAPKTETPAAVAATPAAIEEWTTKSPELKALFAKSPELQAQIMEMARTNEAAKPVLEIVSTPEELMKPWYQPELHFVDHIEPRMRVTRIFIERDVAIEEKIKHKVELSREYLQNRVAQISLDHKH